MAMINTKLFEPQFNVYFSKLTYAVYEDIERDWNGELKYCELIYQNYQNLLLDKKSRSDGLKNRFTISSEVKQYLTELFMKMVKELGVIEITNEDTIESISDQLESEIAESYTLFMWNVAANYRAKFGETLKNACDTTSWFKNKLVGLLPVYATRATIIELLYNEFNTFLKAMSWHIGKFNWYYESSISSTMFLGFLAQLGLEQIMLDELSGCVRPKAPPKPAGMKVATTPAAIPSMETHQDVDEMDDFDDLLI